MFVLSQAVVSVFALTVLLNVFYFDPTQSAETLTNFTSCEECTKDVCHTENNNTCIILADTTTYSCLQCNATLENGDTQFYSQSDCEAACSQKEKCLCDGACYVCALTTDAATLAECTPPTQMVNETCIPSPYVPPTPPSSTPPAESSG
ncbi:uncharacterized protein LOC132921612 [Rhopalosiphum padi]|uniref:uncharacterized protein LOC132921612 n=1 Tax=Rhopalosiphum padi TaxID=40932 RepID=UPI00298E048C|nr:uncharacterized protein LOC132921612 [Rhopalosiphum padi]